MILPDPSLFYSPSSGSTSLFGTEHAADARSQIGDFPSAFKSLDGKLLGEEALIPIFSKFSLTFLPHRGSSQPRFTLLAIQPCLRL